MQMQPSPQVTRCGAFMASIVTRCLAFMTRIWSVTLPFISTHAWKFSFAVTSTLIIGSIKTIKGNILWIHSYNVFANNNQWNIEHLYLNAMDHLRQASFPLHYPCTQTTSASISNIYDHEDFDHLVWLAVSQKSIVKHSRSLRCADRSNFQLIKSKTKKEIYLFVIRNQKQDCGHNPW